MQVFYPCDLGQFSQKKCRKANFVFKLNDISFCYWKAFEKCNPLALFNFSFFTGCLKKYILEKTCFLE